MSRGFSVVAIVAAFNEADVIGTVVGDLIEQGISVYFLDDGSTDGTVEAVEPYSGRGVIRIERLRETSSGTRDFDWEQILHRKAQLASEIDADWFIHHDADEFRESPWAGVTLKDAIERVDAFGYNAIDFASLDFRPTHDRFRGGDDVRAAFPFYSEGAAYDKVQIRCWKKTDPVDLASTGGHEARFESRKVFPIRFLLRHYPVRGQSHGDRKVFVERQPRFVEGERARGWHVQYDNLAKGTSFVHDPCTLRQFDPVDVRIALSLRHRGVEALEQSLETAKSDVEVRTKDVERLQEHLRLKSVELADAQTHLKALDGELMETRTQLAQKTSELASRRDEIEGLNHALEQRKAEVDNFQAAVTDLLKQLDAFRQSLSWRFTAPARAVLRLLRGR